MKKITMLLLGFFCFMVLTFSRLAFAGGPMGGGGAGAAHSSQDTRPLTDMEKFQLEQDLKPRVSRLNFSLYNYNDNADFYFSVDVQANGDYKGMMEGIEEGDYNISTYAQDNNGDALFNSYAKSFHIFPDTDNLYKAVLRLANNYRYQLVLENLPGDYNTDGKCYDVSVKFDNSTYTACGYRNGKGLEVSIYLPPDITGGQIFVQDDQQNTYSTAVTGLSIFDAISGPISVPYTPMSNSGNLKVQVAYEYEDMGVIASISSASPSAQLLTFGLSMVETAEFIFIAINHDFSIQKMTFEFPSAAVECSSGGMALFSSSTLVGRNAIIGDWKNDKAYANFSGLRYRIPRNTTQGLIGALNLNSWSNSCMIDGVNVQTILTGFEAVNENTAEVVKWSGRISGNSMYVYKSTPTITTMPLPESLQNGLNNINKTKVTGSNFGFIDWAEISYSVEKSPELSLAGAQVYNWATDQVIGGTSVINNAGVGSSTSYITFVPTFPQTVSGDGETYVLRVDVRGVINGSYITSRIESSSAAYVQPAAYADVAATDLPFIWSDRSALMHSKNSLDWNNDYLVHGLPTSKQTLTR